MRRSEFTRAARLRLLPLTDCSHCRTASTVGQHPLTAAERRRCGDAFGNAGNTENLMLTEDGDPIAIDTMITCFELCSEAAWCALSRIPLVKMQQRYFTDA